MELLNVTVPRSPFTSEELVALIERASPLHERLSGGFVPADDPTGGPEAARRVAEWRAALGNVTPSALEKRLEWDGHTLDAVTPLLGPVRMQAGAALPAWAKVFEEGAAQFTEGDPIRPATTRFVRASQPIAFEEIVGPFVRAGAQTLRACAGDSYACLSDDAHAALERSLLTALSDLAAKPLFIEFATLRSVRQLMRPALKDDPTANRFYQTFVTEMRTGRFKPFINKYPVLARLLALRVQFWTQSMAEFLLRLQDDWDHLEARFGQGTPLTCVTALTAGLSDPHHGGRSVLSLTFASGVRVVYKPRPLTLDQAFYGLIDWINGHEALLPLRTLAVLSRPTHGWVEFITHEACEGPEELQQYYTRAGMMLCLAYLLQGADFHRGNLIAHGPHPILIDLEVLLQPVIKQLLELNAVARHELMKQMHYSVLHTGLLPQWFVGADGGAFDISGLSKGFAANRTMWGLVEPNTDAMKPGAIQLGLEEYLNNPTLGADAPEASDYVAEIVEGFTALYRLLLTHREALLAPESPFQAFAGQEIRFVLRGTNIYGRMLRKTQQPKYLRAGVDRNIEQESLIRPFLSTTDRHPHWPLLAAEQAALDQLDIPYFSAHTDRDNLCIGPEAEVPDYFEEASFGLSLQQLRDISEADLRLQAGFIRGAFRARTARHDRTTARDLQEFSPTKYADRETWIAEATRLGDLARQQAIYASDESASWVALSYQQQAHVYRFQPLPYMLFDGVSGVALFLAALDRCLGGQTDYGRLAHAVLRPLRENVRRDATSFRSARAVTIGGAMGVASIVYAFTKIGQLLGDPTLLDDARETARPITEERIASDTEFDICQGAAGAILGLLPLYQARPDDALRGLLQQCGQHLLDHRKPDPVTGLRAWPTMNGMNLSGFSHGVAGIGYALARLYEITENPELLDAMKEAYAYERGLYVPQRQNWSDVRVTEAWANDPDTPALSSTWCHGAPGIGLGRLGTLPIYDDDGLREDLARALDATAAHPGTAHDHLCCGNLGRVSILQTAAERLGEPRWAEAARAHASRTIDCVRAEGQYRVVGGEEEHGITLFQGTSGIGYAFLRLAFPGVLPDLLLWE